MTGAIAAAVGGNPVVLKDISVFGAMSPTVGDNPRSLFLGGAGAYSGGHLIYNITARDGSGDNVFEWLRDGNSANYECLATVTSGTLSTGTTGSWLNLGSVQTWTKASGATVTFTLAIGRAGLSTAVVTGTVTL